YALSEPEAGSDAAGMRARAARDGGSYVLNGTKRWITNAGVAAYYTVMAGTRPQTGASRRPPLRGGKGDRGVPFRPPRAQPHPRALLRRLRHPGRPAGRRGR